MTDDLQYDGFEIGMKGAPIPNEDPRFPDVVDISYSGILTVSDVTLLGGVKLARNSVSPATGPELTTVARDPRYSDQSFVEELRRTLINTLVEKGYPSGLLQRQVTVTWLPHD